MFKIQVITTKVWYKHHSYPPPPLHVQLITVLHNSRYGVPRTLQSEFCLTTALNNHPQREGYGAPQELEQSGTVRMFPWEQLLSTLIRFAINEVQQKPTTHTPIQTSGDPKK